MTAQGEKIQNMTDCLMNITIREYRKEDAAEAVRIWNGIVEEGRAFPQTELLTEITGDEFFSAQSFTGIARDAGNGELAGLYLSLIHI